MKSGALALVIVFLLSAATFASAADGWGNLKGRFVYDGDPPPVAVPFAPGKPVDESLVVDRESGGVANIVVWVRSKQVDVHPDFAAAADSQVDWQWKNLRYDPHVVVLPTGQKLVVKNNDGVGHFFQIDTLRNRPRMFGVVPGESKQVVLAEPETLPIMVKCTVHPWERAWLVVRDNPYVAVTTADGAFELSKLPAGEWEFQFWHEKAGLLKAKPDWTKGRAKLKIAADETTDLGTVRLNPKLFK